SSRHLVSNQSRQTGECRGASGPRAHPKSSNFAGSCNSNCRSGRGLQEPGYRNYISPRVGFWVPTTRTVRTKPEVTRRRSSSASVCFSFVPGVDDSESNGSSNSPRLQKSACPGG